ncbi:MAG: dihydropteroate synthase, partial [Ignavibacteriota bacterium]
VIVGLISAFPEAVLSIDTTSGAVAEMALEAGVTIINDVSGGTEDNAMFQIAARHDAPLILMHGYGPQFSASKIEEYQYRDVVSEVFSWLEQRIALAREHGIKLLLADIGFGFAKGVEDNISLLRDHEKFIRLGVPLVLGVSRKSTIGNILGGLPHHGRLSGSIAAAVYGAEHGARIIRTHDVKETSEALLIIDRLRSAS